MQAEDELRSMEITYIPLAMALSLALTENQRRLRIDCLTSMTQLGVHIWVIAQMKRRATSS